MNFNLECGLQATFFVHQSEGKLMKENGFADCLSYSLNLLKLPKGFSSFIPKANQNSVKWLLYRDMN